MKANAPEKIYLQVCGDCSQTDCEGCKFEDLEDNITWCRDKIFERDIEYTRTDAFIKKACEFLKDHMAGYDICEDDIERSVESFKLAMKL